MTAKIIDMQEFRQKKKAEKDQAEARLVYAQIDKLIAHLKVPKVDPPAQKITTIPPTK